MNTHVSMSRRAGLGFRADQGEVWDEIGERVRYSRAHAPSGAYADYLATRQRDLEEMASAFRPLPGQVGFVACIGEEVAGLEAIGRPEVFAQAYPGLLRGYLIDAIDHALVRARRPATKPASRFDAPEPFLAALANARVEASPSLGLGTDLRIEDERVSACALNQSCQSRRGGRAHEHGRRAGSPGLHGNSYACQRASGSGRRRSCPRR